MTTAPTSAEPRAVNAALTYAARGWAVFPLHTIRSARCSCRRDCSNSAKHPITRHGLHDATTDPTTIATWWHRWPWANVGIATGALSGLVVIDIDPAHGGRESLDRVQSLMGTLPATLTAATGGGGEHRFFARPGQGEFRNTAGRLPGLDEPLPGVDLRGDGGYVVAAPSRHRSGRSYTWVDLDVVPADIPPWLRPAPRPVVLAASGWTAVDAHGGAASRYGIAALRREVADVRATAIGGRNDRLNRAAFSLGMLVASGDLDQVLVEAELLTAALDVALPEAEARTSIRSGLSAGIRKPRRRQQA